MGVVYRALDRELGRDVALKTLPYPEPQQLVELKREFRSAAQLTHPNLIELHELVQDGQDCFFTMELLDGHDLVESLWREREHRDQGVDLGRALKLISQLVQGVKAIHDAGLLHRDIKPSNTMVVETEQLVILDFGLARLDRHDPLDPNLGMTGTLVYMAPEQFWAGQEIGRAADLYGVGAVAFEALSGHPPFEGEFDQVFLAKRAEAPSLRASVPALPAWLDNLIRVLLDPKPSVRPSSDEVLATLANHGVGVEDFGRRALRPPFVGRTMELQRLDACLQASANAGRTMHVLGGSGIGKSTLLERFVQECERSGEAVVLRGRCHPQESVPYKALDGVVDALSRYLALQDSLDHAPLEHGAALQQLFPVLGSLDWLKGQSDREQARELVTRRRQGARALRELLARVAAERKLIIWIDDLQWGDLDSLVLLRELSSAPSPLRSLLILSYRQEDLYSSPLLAELARDPLEPHGVERETLELSGLGAAEIQSLTARVLEELGATAPPMDDLFAESGGSPMFATELARHLATRSSISTTAAGLRLSTVIGERIGELDEFDTRILELVALSAFPLTRVDLLNAAGVSPGERHRLSRLERQDLLRTRPGLEHGTAIYHDRIAEAVIARIDSGARRARHEALVETLEGNAESDPEALVVHCLGAERYLAASGYAQLAGDRAVDKLAFDRAAELYAIALAHTTTARHELLLKRAEALANSGRGAESGTCYLEAAAAMAVPGHEGELQRLRHLGAEQLIRSGRLDEGLSVQREVLASFGVKLPATARRAQIQALGRRFWLMLRGLRISLRDTDAVEPDTLRRLDALWSASTSLAMMNFAIADAVGTQHLLGALAAGERSRLSKAISYEAAFEAALGSPTLHSRAERKLALAEAIAEETAHPHDRAWVSMSRCSAMWGAGRWALALDAGERALDLYENECRAAIWETSITRLYVLSSLAFRGDLRALMPRLDDALRDAIDRGDLFAANNYRLGQMSIARLAADRVQESFDLAEQARATWPKTIYHTQHYHHVVLTVQAELYRSQPEAALAQIEAALPDLQRAQLNFHHVPWTEILHLRARAALSLARARLDHRSVGSRSSSAWPLPRLLRLATKTAKTVQRSPTPMGVPFAAVLRAAVSALRGDDAQAISHLERALIGFEHAQMDLYREATRYRLGQLRGGHEGRDLRRTGRDWLAEQGVVRPAAFIAMLTPGFECGADSQSRTRAPRP